MGLVSEENSGYVWAAACGGAFVLLIAVFCCIYRAVKQSIRNGVWARESTHGMEEGDAYRRVVVGADQPRRSSVGAKDRGWL